MKHYIFIFEDCALFEVTLLANFLNEVKEEVIIIGEEKVVKVHEGFTITVDVLLEDIQLDDLRSFTITGGNPANLNEKDKLQRILKEILKKQDVQIGAICGGTWIAGQLLEIPMENLADEELVEYQNILASPPNKYVDFAITMLEKMDLYRSREDYEETVRFFKEFKSS